MAYIYEAQKRTQSLVKTLQVGKKIPDSNKNLAKRYMDYRGARGLNPRTINKNLYCLAVYPGESAGQARLRRTYGTLDKSNRKAARIQYPRINNERQALLRPPWLPGQQDQSEMWNNSPAIEQFRKAQPPLQCNGCPHFDVCRGGPVSNYAPTLLRRSQEEPMSCPLQEVSTAE